MMDKIVLIEPSAEEDSPLIVLPFVLKEEAADAYTLVEQCVITQRLIFQSIVIELCSGGEISRKKEQPVESMNVLCASY